MTLAGLAYPLARGVLPTDACLGLGNSVVPPGAAVTIHEGVVALLVESGTETFGGGCRPWGAPA